MEGTIKTLTDKGFGFITVDGEEKDLFFHSNELQGVSYEELKVGDRVSFEKGESPKGPNATSITRA
jgi:CspA family cold shock protein